MKEYGKAVQVCLVVHQQLHFENPGPTLPMRALLATSNSTDYGSGLSL
jgi:hypothetical protein